MNSFLGLAELLVVLICVMGWGAYELWSVRRDRQRKVTRKPDDESKR